MAIATLLGKFVRFNLIVAMATMLSGCIPLMVGGYIGYEMSQKDSHAEFCTQHVGDPSCHP